MLERANEKHYFISLLIYVHIFTIYVYIHMYISNGGMPHGVIIPLQE